MSTVKKTFLKTIKQKQKIPKSVRNIETASKNLELI